MDQETAQILYVDDEKQNLISFKASFRKYYTVHIAQSGEEALGILKNHPIDLIISDQRMPKMTGVELFEQVLHDYPDPIRMVMTGYSDIQAIINAINKGKIYYYITKPWKPEELHLIIENALEAHRLKQENQHLQAEKNALLLEAEKQAKENILSQFETLKNQVNPHFLFNCLNALSSLVHEDPDIAEDFISKLTKVYRYVLEVKDENLVPLSEELAFAESYFFLQKIRFGEGLKWETNIDPSRMDEFIPPLTLQILLENAIKHNIISRDQQLMIDIYAGDSGNLWVQNNYQKRQDKVESTGIGLENLRGRYQFLSEEQPEFYLEQNYYIAKVPLIRKS